MKRMILAMAALLLAGCGSEMASYLISGREVNMTLERTKPYFWSSAWELTLIVRLDPVCQRRHKLRNVASNALRVDVYSPEKGVFILRQGKRWYVTQLNTCELQQFGGEPPEPGEPVGAFMTKGGEFKFVPAVEEK